MSLCSQMLCSQVTPQAMRLAFARRAAAGFALALAALSATSSVAAAQTFDQCGTVEAGVSCPLLFRSDDQRLWLLDVPLTGFQVGDRLRVMGDEDPFCFTICQQGDGCIFSSVLLPCQPLQPTFCTPGVPNSTGSPGAVMGSGSLDVAANDLTLTASQLPPGSFAFFIAARALGAPIPMPGGSVGTLCLTGNVSRFVAQVGTVGANGVYRISTAPGSGAQMFSLAAFPTPSGAVAVVPGDTWHFQCWHRDVSGGAAVSNFTEGLSLQFQ
ncbi:MAG: hypothetical protein R3F49_13630 [Planctomycetota bacterium]